jgi:hypothetical protein
VPTFFASPPWISSVLAFEKRAVGMEQCRMATVLQQKNGHFWSGIATALTKSCTKAKDNGWNFSFCLEIRYESKNLNSISQNCDLPRSESERKLPN